LEEIFNCSGFDCINGYGTCELVDEGCKLCTERSRDTIPRSCRINYAAHSLPCTYAHVRVETAEKAKRMEGERAET